MTRILEICVDEPAGVAAAIAGRADRLELCSALAVGGLTPGAAFVRHAIDAARPAGLAIHAIVRPRTGNFRYDAAETGLAIDEGLSLIDQGVDGLVFGAARNGALDSRVLERWRAAMTSARADIALTLHRAIDVVADPVATVAIAADLGFDRILTSGGAATALAGAETIARMMAAAGSRITVMAGSGVTPDTVTAVIDATGVQELHASAGRTIAEPDARVAALGFATPPRRHADLSTVRALRDAIDR